MTPDARKGQFLVTLTTNSKNGNSLTHPTAVIPPKRLRKVESIAATDSTFRNHYEGLWPSDAKMDSHF